MPDSLSLGYCSKKFVKSNFYFIAQNGVWREGGGRNSQLNHVALCINIHLTYAKVILKM